MVCGWVQTTTNVLRERGARLPVLCQSRKGVSGITERDNVHDVAEALGDRDRWGGPARHSNYRGGGLGSPANRKRVSKLGDGIPPLAGNPRKWIYESVQGIAGRGARPPKRGWNLRGLTRPGDYVRKKDRNYSGVQ